ncbi:MAG: leucyl aminopeptidase [Actinomycetes bacterium]
MSLAFRASAADPASVRTDLLAVPAFAGRVLGPGAEVVDDALDGGLLAFLGEAGFDGKVGEALLVPVGTALGARSALVVGLGTRRDMTLDDLRKVGALIAKRAARAASAATTVLEAIPDSMERADAAQALVEGVVLGGYQYLEYKSKAKAARLARVTLLGRGGASTTNAAARGALVAGAACWARDIINTPSNDKAPEVFARAAQTLLRGKGVRVQVLGPDEIRRARMGGVIGVGQGSARRPRFVKVTYSPPGARGPALALVGKGVVFDTGGISIKPAAGMETMKTDMSGAAAVLATMSVLKDLGVKHKVVAYAPLVENMPSGTAIRPGDVLKHRNGMTTEVLNTDAEGRLILADALALAVDDGAGAIVDVATLTGACVVALGDRIAGLMGNDDAWRDTVRAAADQVGEAVWPLPLPKEYQSLLESEVADLRNISTGGYGGTLTAGLFLQHFVGEVPWAHLDIAGPSRAATDSGYTPKGGTGFATRTLIELARSYTPPKRTRG